MRLRMLLGLGAPLFLLLSCENHPKKPASDSLKESRSLVFLPFNQEITSPSEKSFSWENSELLYQMYDSFVAQLTRLDADALQIQSQRPLPWTAITTQLRSEIDQVKNHKDLGRILRRLDSAYPSLHSSLDFHSQDSWYESLVPELPIRIYAEAKTHGPSTFRIFLNDPSWGSKVGILGGEKIIAINQRPIEDWSLENFHFCKWPLQRQCDLYLFEHLQQEILSWKQNERLELSYIDLSGKIQRTLVPVTLKAPDEDSLLLKKQKAISRLECGREPNRYPNFSLSYQGNRLCVYVSKDNPNIAIMRISSFSYASRRLLAEQKIRSLNQELASFTPYWRSFGNFEKLIIDVTDNTGGSSPVPYYQHLFQSSFQEQYYKLKRIQEFDSSPGLLENINWQEPGQLITFKIFQSSGIWDQTPIGSFFPAIPMFCRYDDQDCRIGRFEPITHSFKGKIDILLNSNCISSCDGFIWALKTHLGSRVRLIGQEQAADSSYARARINVIQKSANEFETLISAANDPLPEETIFYQTISVSLSTDSSEKILSGSPLKLDYFVEGDGLDSQQFYLKALEASLDLIPGP